MDVLSVRHLQCLKNKVGVIKTKTKKCWKPELWSCVYAVLRVIRGATRQDCSTSNKLATNWNFCGCFFLRHLGVHSYDYLSWKHFCTYLLGLCVMQLTDAVFGYKIKTILQNTINTSFSIQHTNKQLPHNGLHNLNEAIHGNWDVHMV